MAQSPLVGAWRLASYEYIGEDGDVTYPWGKDAGGYIVYTADGYMSVVMSGSARPMFASSDLTGGTAEEKIAAAETYMSYCGRYELHEDHVVHHIELALFPNRVGTHQTRYFKLSGDRLNLRTPPMLVDGKERTGYLVWERVPAAGNLR